MCVSAWESYIEELIRESLRLLQPLGPIMGAWPALNAYVLGLLGRFHTPSQANVEQLIRNSLGLPDIHLFWRWQNQTPVQVVQRLTQSLEYRHEIAHGVNPRPTVHHQYATELPDFILRIAECTDSAVRNHLVNVDLIPAPWP